jgi:hypothetical protein
VDTPFRSETGGIRGFQSFDPSVNRTAVTAYTVTKGEITKFNSSPGRLRQADDRARLFGVFHLGHLDAHMP